MYHAKLYVNRELKRKQGVHITQLKKCLWSNEECMDKWLTYQEPELTLFKNTIIFLYYKNSNRESLKQCQISKTDVHSFNKDLLSVYSIIGTENITVKR